MNRKLKPGDFTFVASDTNPNKLYRVYVDESGGLRCSCPGYVFRNDCKHLKKGGEELYARVPIHNVRQDTKSPAR